MNAGTEKESPTDLVLPYPYTLEGYDSEAMDIIFAEYAQKYVNKLTDIEATYLKKHIEEYDTAYTAYEKYKLSESKSLGDYASISYNLHKPTVFRETSTNLTKAFLFTQYKKIPFGSEMNKKAFQILKRGEFENYYKQYLNRWLTFAEETPEWGDIIIPPPTGYLNANEDITIEHFMPFISHRKIYTEMKTPLIDLLVRSLQDMKYKTLNQIQIEYILWITRKFATINLTPMIPSIRKVYNLDGVPDGWVTEAYDLIRSNGKNKL